MSHTHKAMADALATTLMPEDIRSRAKTWGMENFCEVLWNNAFHAGWKECEKEVDRKAENTLYNNDMLESIHQKLMKMQIASCSCFTKTPVASFHREDCNYRILSDISTDLFEISLALEKK